MCARSSGGNAESVALALRECMAEVKRVPVNDDGGKEVQAGYAEMLTLQCHLALSRNRPGLGGFRAWCRGDARQSADRLAAEPRWRRSASSPRD